MRTLVISDLHLGNGGPYDVFAGEHELTALLDRLAAPLRVIVNGDGFDFLMNDDPLELAERRAVEQARSIAEHRTAKSVLAAFGRVLAGGGEVILRLGNHDIELALPAVQAVLRESTAQPAEIAARLKFETGSRPGFVEVGGASLLVTHGEHNDAWNQVDYPHLGSAAGGEFVYAPGSRLVKRFINPLTKRHGMRFVNLLKPDFQGGALAALAVSPSIMKLVFQDASADIAWQLFRNASATPTFVEGGSEDEEDLGLASRIEDAELSAEERAALESAFGDDALSFADEDEPLLKSARLKLVKKGLELYARVQKKTVEKIGGHDHFSLEPADTEWREVKRLAHKYGVGAVIMGHTHAARWRSEGGLVFANSGTWSWLMQMPPCEAAHQVWAEYLEELQKNPGLAPNAQKQAKVIGRFTGVLAEPVAGGGARVQLVQWNGERIEVLGETRVEMTKSPLA